MSVTVALANAFPMFKAHSFMVLSLADILCCTETSRAVACTGVQTRRFKRGTTRWSRTRCPRTSQISSGSWLATATLCFGFSLADVVVFDLLHNFYQAQLPDCLAAFPGLNGLVERTKARPGIRAYLASAKYQRIERMLPLPDP